MANAGTMKPSRRRPSLEAADGVKIVRTPVFATLSHRGRVRHSNQDACAALPEVGAFVVCDGMGGAAGGEVASRLATEAFLNYLAHAASTTPDATMPVRITEAVQAANQAVFRHSCTSPSLYGMGTTLVALLQEEAITGSKLWIAHVGDSRCYRLRSGRLQLLTRDHSLVEEQVRAGVLSQMQASLSPMRNIITRAIGTQATVEAEISSCDAQPDDLYLLASDGLSRELDEVAIERIVSSEASRTTFAADRGLAKAGQRMKAVLETTCHALVDAANAHGGHDNITVLLVACP